MSYLTGSGRPPSQAIETGGCSDEGFEPGSSGTRPRDVLLRITTARELSSTRDGGNTYRLSLSPSTVRETAHGDVRAGQAELTLRSGRPASRARSDRAGGATLGHRARAAFGIDARALTPVPAAPEPAASAGRGIQRTAQKQGLHCDITRSSRPPTPRATSRDLLSHCLSEAFCRSWRLEKRHGAAAGHLTANTTYAF